MVDPAVNADVYQPLIVSLLDEFEAAGTPRLKPGDRPAVVALLTRVMTNLELQDSYLRLLKSELQRRDRSVRMRLLTLESVDLPEEKILSTGFTELEDAALADIAISPAALKAITTELYDDPEGGSPGEWFYEPIMPEDLEAPAVAADNNATVNDPVWSARRPASAARRRVAIATAALAASLLIGVFLGSKLGGGSSTQAEIVLAKVDARGDPTRGIKDVELQVTNGGDRLAFVTIVGVFPEKRRTPVFNQTEEDFVSVPAHQKVLVKHLPNEFEGATVVFVILSDVPAGEATRKILSTATSAGEAAGTADRLRRALEALNIRAAVQLVQIPTGKN